MRGVRLIFDNTFDDIPNIDKVDKSRQGLLSSIQNIDTLYNAFNFREKGFPNVIYQKPFQNSWSLYVKNDTTAFEEIDNLIKHISENGLVVNEREYKLVEFFEIRDIVVMPSKTEQKHFYKLVTPLILFSKEHFPMYFAILQKYKDKPQELNQELQSAAKRLIISNLKFQLQQQLKYKKYEALEDIDIEWNDFAIKFGQFHRNERKTPLIFGSFKSSYILPRFIGQKIGKGFGQINLIRNESSVPC